NAHYQGTTLGNLHSGSSVGQLKELVAKWFLGSDHPQAATSYRMVNGSLFVNGASAGDIVQGQVGDCYFVAALAGVAKFSPQIIQQMATDNGDGTFTIRFYHAGVADYVTVDRALPTTSGGNAEYANFGGKYDSSSNELWVALIEKGYAQITEEGWTGHAASNSYAAIDGGYSDLAIQHITGRAAGWKWATSASPNDLIAALAAGKPTVLASNSNPGNGVIDSHGYALIGYNPATAKFALYNPWGSTIQLTFSQIQQSFMGFWGAL
ncbi:MAG TPA: C2 family cysteine protease, partial [Gemmataceae bacterium]|nr:C2 family cysteine protease [Gemmataceae bacterium]